MTGLHPQQHKITSDDPPNLEDLSPGEFQRSDSFLQGRQRMIEHIRNAPTLAGSLRDRGYATLQTGKWWLGHFKEGGFTHGMTQGGRHGDDGLQIGRETMEPIETFLDECQKDEKPFFIGYGPLLPHNPHTPPERLLEKYRTQTERIQGVCFTHNAVDLDAPEKNVRWRWIIDRDWKLIVPDPTNEPNSAPELYNITEDPFEHSNVFHEQIELSQLLRTQLGAWWTP